MNRIDVGRLSAGVVLLGLPALPHYTPLSVSDAIYQGTHECCLRTRTEHPHIFVHGSGPRARTYTATHTSTHLPFTARHAVVLTTRN